MRFPIIAALLLLVAAVLACAEQPSTAPSVPPDGPEFVGPGCGGFTPTAATVPVDSVVSFTRDTISISCATRYGEIAPASGDAGFSQGSGCILTATTGNVHFKVRGCAAGSVNLRIYVDSTKSTLLQTIPITIELP